MQVRFLLPFAAACVMLAVVAVDALAQAVTRLPVGTAAPVTLQMRNVQGQVITSWASSGYATVLRLEYPAQPATTANTDTSMNAWDGSTDGYSWSKITMMSGAELPKRSADEWILPCTLFDATGTAYLQLVHSRVDEVRVLATPAYAALPQETDPVIFTPLAPANFLIEITSHTALPDQVYVERPFEFSVTPRDKYLNALPDILPVIFSARFATEFDGARPDAFPPQYDKPTSISSSTILRSYSTVAHTRAAHDVLQQLSCTLVANPACTGRSNDFEILNHAPTAFSLLSPPSGRTWNTARRTKDTCVFLWGTPSPLDPVTNIRISRTDTTHISDVVTWKVIMLDSATLTRAYVFDSDQWGATPRFTAPNAVLEDVRKNISGQTYPNHVPVVWYVEATDGLFVTKSNRNASTGRPGSALHIYLDGVFADTSATGLSDLAVGIPGGFILAQNHPNPFNPATIIPFTLSVPARVTLTVCDVYGAVLRRLLDDVVMDAGAHDVRFDAGSLPSGVYVCTLACGGRVQVRRMTLLK